MAWANPWLMVFRHLPRVSHYSAVFPNRSFFQGPVPLRIGSLLGPFFWEKGPLNFDIVGKIWFGLHRIFLQETSKPTKATKYAWLLTW